MVASTHQLRDHQKIERLARQKFPASNFVHVRDSIVFTEHTTKDRKGRTQQYNKEALQAICDRCNYRILDSDDFAALTDGHTPEHEEIIKGAKMPEVMGFAGNFRVVKFGRLNPRYAIACDEWHFRESHAKAKKLPRRSVEVWMAKSMGERIIDPIAMLGAETPRLDTGLRFARLASGETVEKYTASCPAAAPAAPAGGNTFVKKFAKTETPSMDQDAIVKAVLDALMTTKQWQKLTEMTDEAEVPAVEDEAAIEEAPADEPLDEAPIEPPIADPADEMPNEEPIEPPPAEETGDLGGDIGAEEPAPAPEPAAEGEEEDEDETEMYSINRTARNREVAKYRRLEAENRSLQAENVNLRKAMAQDANAKEDSRRLDELTEATMKYSLDLEKEKDRCLYSRGSKMTPEEFNARIEAIHEFKDPLVDGRTIPPGEMPAVETPAADAAAPASGIRDRYSKDTVEKAIKYMTDARSRGEKIADLDDAVAKMEAAK